MGWRPQKTKEHEQGIGYRKFKNHKGCTMKEIETLERAINEKKGGGCIGVTSLRAGKYNIFLMEDGNIVGRVMDGVAYNVAHAYLTGFLHALDGADKYATPP